MYTKKITFYRRVYNSFLKVHGPSLSVISLALAFLPMFFSIDKKIEISWFILLIVMGSMIVLVLVNMAYDLHIKSSNILPKAITTVEPPSFYKNVERIILLEPSEIFGNELVISFYIEENGLEILFGIGYVATVQDNGNIQAALTRVVESKGETLEKLKNNDADVLSKLLVKPSMPTSLID